MIITIGIGGSGMAQATTPNDPGAVHAIESAVAIRAPGQIKHGKTGLAQLNMNADNMSTTSGINGKRSNLTGLAGEETKSGLLHRNNLNRGRGMVGNLTVDNGHFLLAVGSVQRSFAR